MDEAYASPDSDGHASLPSPTDSTFDLSQLPLKRRGARQEPITVSSSFVRTPEDDDSDDDSEGDETFSPGTLAREQPYRMLQTSPLLSSPGKSTISKILTPMNSKNDDNTPRTTPRRTKQTPRKAQAGSLEQGENIDPNQGEGSGRKLSPPRLIVQKPDYGSSDEEEEAVIDKTAPIPLNLTGESFPQVDAAQSTNPEPSTPFGDAFSRSFDALPTVSTPDAQTKRAGLRKWRNSLPAAASPAAIPPSPPTSASPLQDSPQLPGPADNPHNLTPNTPRLRYLNWLSSDSIDDADDEPRDIPAGHSLRLKKAQAQRIVDETAFLGGDEASYVSEEVEVDNDNEMLDRFHREENSGPEERLTTLSEESNPAAELKPVFSEATKVVTENDAETVKGPTGESQDLQSTYDGAEDGGDSSAGPVEREVQPPTSESEDYFKASSSDSSIQKSDAAGQSQTTGLAVTKAANFNSATPTSSPLKGTKTRTPDFTLGGPSTTPQGVSNSAKGNIRHTSLSGGNPTPRGSFASDATIRPTTSPGHLQENSTTTALTGLSSQESPRGEIDAFPETIPQNSLSPETFIAQSTPADFYAGYDLWAIKKSSRGRRVSMNTPPSTLSRHSLSGNEFLDNPPDFSSLGSGFSFPSQPLRYEEWDPESVSREFTPPFPVEGVNGFRRQGLERLKGVDAPHNTPTPAAGKRSGAPVGWKGKDIRGRKGRVRSKSDPVQKKLGGKGLKELFTSGRVEKKKKKVEAEYSEEEGSGGEKHDDAVDVRKNKVEKSIFSDESEGMAAEVEGEDGDDDLLNDDELDLSDTDDDEVDGRHWSGFTQDFQSSFARVGKDAPTVVSQSEPSHDPSSISLGNVEFRVHTPASIGEFKGDVSDGSNKTLWYRMAQAEAENDRFRRLLESNNIKIEDQDLGSSGNLTVQDSRDLSSSRNSDYNTSEDLGALRRRVLELESLLEGLGRRDVELRGENERKDMLVSHWRTQYNDVQKLALQNRQRALSLESHVKELEQQASVDSINHDREINEVVSKLHGEKKHSRQKSLGLEDRIKFFEQRLHDATEAHRKDTEEKERTISHLRQALDNRRGSIGSASVKADHHLITELQEKLYEQQQVHEAEAQATEDKYTNLLSEKEGLVRHLQAELDEMVNLMPVDHGSSRMIDEEEAEDWLDEKSREISQYYDDGLDQIITELHGTGEREDFEEAVEEAEMSLRRVADEAGLGEPLDKATLAAFGIRQLRSEYVLLKRVLIESEGRVKELMQTNDEHGRKAREAEEKLEFAVDERDAFRTAANDAEAAGKMLADQVDALREKLQEAEKHIRQLVTEHDALNQRSVEAEERVETLEADKVALQRLVNDTKRLNDMLKSQAAEAEQRNQGFEEEILGLRRQLAEEKDHVSVVETETITFRQQLSEWEETAAAVGKQRDAFQVQLKESTERVKVAEKEKEELAKKLLEAVKGQGDTREVDALKKTVKELQGRIKVLHEQQVVSAATVAGLEGKAAHADQAAQRLAAEKEFLKAELEIAAGETKAARGRFAQLLHDTAEKEAKWASVKQEMERSVTANDMGSAEAYQRSLALIVQEIEKESSTSATEDEEEQVDLEGVQDPELVKVVIRAFRWRDRRFAESEERNRRYRGAAKKWMKENEKKRGRVEELVAENRELVLKLKAEKKSSDEKLGQLILALRRGE